MERISMVMGAESLFAHCAGVRWIARGFASSFFIGAGLAMAAASSAGAETLKVGVLATLEGTYTALGEDGVRGVRAVLGQHDYKAGVYDIELVYASTDTSAESAVRGAENLVNEHGVELILGPVSGSEGIAIRDFAKANPNVTIINGSSAAMETTFVDPAPNFFRFSTDGAQWSKGLGEYVYNEKGYRSVVTIGEDYSFIYTQVFGFVTEFCAAGGDVVDRFWVPLGTEDFSDILSVLPEDEVDAIYLGLGGKDAVNFLEQYQAAGGTANLIGGSIMVDGTVLNQTGEAKAALIGVPSSGPQADTWDDTTWKAYVKMYQDSFPPDERFPTPSLFATSYANATTAAVSCLNQIDAKLGDGHADFRQCLTDLELQSPTGTIRLDSNRQAIGANFVSEVVEQPDGTLATAVVQIANDVNQTLGIDPEAFKRIGLPGRKVPACKPAYE